MSLQPALEAALDQRVLAPTAAGSFDGEDLVARLEAEFTQEHPGTRGVGRLRIWRIRGSHTGGASFCGSVGFVGPCWRGGGVGEGVSRVDAGPGGPAYLGV